MGTPTYLEAFHATPIERVRLIKAGLPAAAVKEIWADFTPSSGIIFESLRISRASIVTGAARGQVLPTAPSERILGLLALVGQVEAMARPAEGFRAPKWMAAWLTEPAPALGGQRPAAFLDTMEGRSLLSSLLAQMQSSAYA